MATLAARRLRDMADNSGRIAAIELLAAAQGIDLRRPLKTGPVLATALAELRRHAAFLAQDRSLTPDIEASFAMIDAGWFFNQVWQTPGEAPVISRN